MIKEPKEQSDVFDVSQQDIKLYSHIGDIDFEPVYDETIESVIDEKGYKCKEYSPSGGWK